MTSQRDRRGPGATVIGVGLLALAAAGIYVVVFSGDDPEEAERASDRARSEPRGSRRSGAWGGASIESASGSAPSGSSRSSDRVPRASDRAGGAIDGDSAPSPRSSARPMMDAGGRAVPVPASRLPLGPPTTIARPTGRPPADVRLRSSEALERITAQRIAELTQHLEAARRDGNTRRIAHLESTIAQMRAQQPRIREHIEATRREVEATSEAATSEEATSEEAADPPQPVSAPSVP